MKKKIFLAALLLLIMAGGYGLCRTGIVRASDREISQSGRFQEKEECRRSEENRKNETKIFLKEVLGEEKYEEVRASEKYYYIGSRKCRICHPNFFSERSEGAHSLSFDFCLEGKEKKNPRCLYCHTTGYGDYRGFVSAEITPWLKGVQCEGCHGPGSMHKAAFHLTEEDLLECSDCHDPRTMHLDMPESREKECQECHTANPKQMHSVTLLGMKESLLIRGKEQFKKVCRTCHTEKWNKSYDNLEEALEMVKHGLKGSKREKGGVDKGREVAKVALRKNLAEIFLVSNSAKIILAVVVAIAFIGCWFWFLFQGLNPGERQKEDVEEKKYARKGIQFWLISNILMLLIFITGISFAFNYWNAGKSLIRQMKKDAIILNKTLRTNIMQMNKIKEKVNIQRLVEEISLTDSIYEIRVIDTKYKIIAATFRADIGMAVNNEHFRKIIEHKSWDEGYLDIREEHQVFVVVTPVCVQGIMVGAVEISFELFEYLQADLPEQKILIKHMEIDGHTMAKSISHSIQNMYKISKIVDLEKMICEVIKGTEGVEKITIIDREGKIIASNAEAEVGKWEKNEEIKKILQGTIALNYGFQLQAKKQKELFVINMPFIEKKLTGPEGEEKWEEFVDGALSVAFDPREYRKNLERIYFSSIIMALVSLLLGSFILILLLRKRVIHPIQKLAAGTKAVARGNLHITVDINSDDELGILGNSFNNMVKETRSKRDEIEHWNEELKRKVEEATKELRESNLKLQEADQLKSQFLNNMSHELRTPLNSIIGFTEIILDGIDGEISERQREDLTAIYNSGGHLLNLINDILDLAKIESGKTEINREDVHLKEVVDRIISITYSLRGNKKLVIKTNINDDLPPAYGDKAKIEQILLNLITNAIKFTEEGEISVKCNQNAGFIVVSVSDTGIGIKKKDIGILFNEFRQIDTATNRRYEGTGLGLAICKKLVEMHGGKIWIESKYEKGTTISFTIPQRQENS